MKREEKRRKNIREENSAGRNRTATANPGFAAVDEGKEKLR